MISRDTDCPTVKTRLHRNRRPKTWDNIDDTPVPLERDLYGHPLAGLLWERKIGRGLVARKLENHPAGHVPMFTDTLNSLYHFYVDDLQKWLEEEHPA